MKKLLTFCLGFILVWTLCFPTVHAAEPQPDDEIAAMQELLETRRDRNWFNYALTSNYSTPADLNLAFFFCTGFEDESNEFTDEEVAFLDKNMGSYWKEMDVFRYPIEKMDAVLTEYFGITLEDSNRIGLDFWLFCEQTNCYYSAPSVHYAEVTVYDVVNQDDGSILVYYLRGRKKDKMQLTLMPNGDSYRILSNIPANASETYQEELSKLLQIAFTREGAYGEKDAYELGRFFYEDPVGFIRTLAKEDASIQERVIDRFCSCMYHEFYPGSWQTFPIAVRHITLTDGDSDVAWDILQQFKQSVTKYWGDEIPETGDAVISVAAALFLSAAAAAVLLSKRRRVTGMAD